MAEGEHEMILYKKKEEGGRGKTGEEVTKSSSCLSVVIIGERICEMTSGGLSILKRGSRVGLNQALVSLLAVELARMEDI